MAYEEWKKEMGDKIKNIKFEKLPQIIKRCPRCNSITLEFDVNTGKIKCTKCGFEENLPILK
ncbi:uncharacterized protein METZ01_LOCUS505877 [marine metagenome]|uniref:TFIIB-type domain-containing protein n=1 Tax=marine metagenome TaxID=408172 RepID=A0A383E9E4_9ZZZZ